MSESAFILKRWLITIQRIIFHYAIMIGTFLKKLLSLFNLKIFLQNGVGGLFDVTFTCSKFIIKFTSNFV